MPEPQDPPSGQSMRMAGNAPSVQGAQELDPAVLAAFFDAEADADVDGDADADMNGGILSRLARQSSFILIPFLFAVVTFLLAFLFLTLRSQGFHSLPTTELVAIGLIVLAMAVLQGMMLYYAGSNSGLWFFSILVGFVLFPPVLFFALAGAAASLITLGIMLVICIAVAWICSAFVQAGHVGIVYSFGNYRRTLPPGPHFLPPWERIARSLDTRESQWTCPQQLVHMSPDEDLSLAGTIAYEVIPEEAHLAVQYVDNWEQRLKERFCAILQNIATAFKPEDFYPWQPGAVNRSDPNSGNDTKEKTPSWNQMNARLLQVMREQAAPWGVQVNWATIHDVTPLPHVDHVEAGGTRTGTARMAGNSGTASTTANSAPSSRPGTARAAPTSSQRQSSAPPVDAGARMAQPPPVAPAAQTQAPADTNKKVDAIIKTYDAVRTGVITDPETIRRLAKRFDAIAQDSALSQNFPFDAARAASNLYARAKYYEDQISASAEFTYNDEYDDDVDIVEDLSGETQLDWRHQPPPDDDLTGGG